MSTIGDLVTSACLEIQVCPPGAGPSDSEMQAGIKALNRLLANWMAAIQKSIAGSYLSSLVTFTSLSSAYSASTDVFVGDVLWERPLVKNLAVDLAPQFGRPVSQELAAVAQQSKQAITTIPAPTL